jgi:hypothetical protein
MANLVGYQAILDESQRVDWPESYAKDLYIVDFEMLMKDDAPETFGWCLRECGTFLFPERCADFLDQIRACAKEYPFPNGRYYFFDGHTLHEVTPRQLEVWQEDGTILLPAGQMEITPTECRALTQKCRSLQREVKQKLEQATAKSVEDYLDGKHLAFGRSAFRLENWDSRIVSDKDRAVQIRNERLLILLCAHNAHNTVIRTRDDEEKAFNLGKKRGYLEAACHFSDLLGLPKPAIHKEGTHA